MGGDGDARLTFWRAVRSAEFWLVLVGSFGAMAGLSAWTVVPAVATGLMIASLPTYMALWPLAGETGHERAWWMTVAVSGFNCLAAACATYVAGVMTRWLWF